MKPHVKRPQEFPLAGTKYAMITLLGQLLRAHIVCIAFSMLCYSDEFSLMDFEKNINCACVGLFRLIVYACNVCM